MLFGFSSRLENDGSQPSHERSDASQSDPPRPSIPPVVPVRPGARSSLHHVCGHPGNNLSGHWELQENCQAPSSSQGIYCCVVGVFSTYSIFNNLQYSLRSKGLHLFTNIRAKDGISMTSNKGDHTWVFLLD